MALPQLGWDRHLAFAVDKHRNFVRHQVPAVQGNGSLRDLGSIPGQHRLPIPDLIVAATAEVHDATVLHVDSDYELIAKVTGQPQRRLTTSAVS